MKHSKKLLSLVLTVLVIAASLTAGMIAYAGSPIAINAINFPDENFRTIVLMECDEDEDGYLSDSEIAGITLFSVTGYLYDLDEDAQIENLKGIEYFTNLKTLRCGGIGLTSLDVKKLTSLTWLDCMGNELEELDVSKNTALRTLNCQSNELTALNVTANTQLTTLSCSINPITSLDLTHNTALETLQCHQNQLTSLNLSQNTALKSLHCSNNHIKELDLSANTLLENVTSNRIGDQTIDGTATVSGGSAFIEISFNSNRDRITATSLDYEKDGEQIVAYSGGNFYTDDFSKLVDGIDYEYNTGIEGAEPLTVHINVERDFFVVCYYTDEKKTTMFCDAQIVNAGDDAVVPSVTAPQCKTFVGWSDTSTNIHEDKEIYAIWRSSHVFRIVDFGDNTIIVNCVNGCGTEKEYLFSELVGAEIGDSNYNEAFDLNQDGYINGRDLAKLKAHQF